MDEMETIRVQAWLWHLINTIHVGGKFDPEGCPECEEIKEFLGPDDPTWPKT